MISDDLVISWIAGFWEGEGSFTIRSGYSFNISQAGDRGKRILEEINRHFDEFGIKSGKVRFGGHCWHLRIRDINGIIRVAELLLPYMRFRGDDVRAKIEFLKQRGYHPKRKWSSAEELFIKCAYKRMSPEEIARELGRSRGAIMSKASANGLHIRRPWTGYELKYLAQNLTISGKELSRILGRTGVAIRSKKYAIRHGGTILDGIKVSCSFPEDSTRTDGKDIGSLLKIISNRQQERSLF